MHLLYLISVWFHILAAAVWIGGIIFLSVVLVPVSRRPEYHRIASSLFHSTGVRFRVVGWVCLGALLLSGAFNLAYRGIDLADPGTWLWQGSFGLILSIKLLLVTIILLISALHDFLIGPRAMRLWQADPASAEAMRLRRLASLIGRVNLILALLVVALGVTLVRGWRL